MLFPVEQAFVGRDEKRAPLKTPAWEAIWPVTGQGFQNTKWLHGSPVFSVNFTNRKNPAKLNYHMLIKKSQAILKCFISRIAFGSRWAQKTKPCLVTFFSARRQGFHNTKWPAVQKGNLEVNPIIRICEKNIAE